MEKIKAEHETRRQNYLETQRKKAKEDSEKKGGGQEDAIESSGAEQAAAITNATLAGGTPKRVTIKKNFQEGLNLLAHEDPQEQNSSDEEGVDSHKIIIN